MAQYKILLIEDDPEWTKLFELKNKKYHTIISKDNIEDAVGLIEKKEYEPDVIVLDLSLTSDHSEAAIKSGIKNLIYLRKLFPHIPIIIYTENNKPETINECVANGSRGFIIKGDTSLKPLGIREYIKKTIEEYKLIYYADIHVGTDGGKEGEKPVKPTPEPPITPPKSEKRSNGYRKKYSKLTGIVLIGAVLIAFIVYVLQDKIKLLEFDFNFFKGKVELNDSQPKNIPKQ